MRNQSRPRSETLPEGGIITGGHLHHPGSHHDEEGVVHPRGWGFVPVAMCLISLSLSLVIYIMGFVNIVGSYDVSPLYTLVVMNWIFTLWSLVLSDWIVRYENTWYMYCGVNTWGDNEVSYWFTWYVLWHSTRGFPRWYWGNLCIGVDARFYYLFSDGNFGVSLKFFVWIEYYEYEFALVLF